MGTEIAPLDGEEYGWRTTEVADEDFQMTAWRECVIDKSACIVFEQQCLSGSRVNEQDSLSEHVVGVKYMYADDN